uniref:Glyco_hydro_35 domain-containing protein n=1 Tax=Rhabditophanes sp. KR3021 TaxID=114890 RepID=A0AC35UBC0_9BILA
MLVSRKNILIFLFLFTFVNIIFTSERNFTIDYDNDQFVLDGKPFSYISGEIHYFRIPSIYWEDRLFKIRNAGLNAVQVYVPWNYHELEQNKFDFNGEKDLVKFLKLANIQGLYVLLRIGPYICAEFENGGLPWFLNNIQNITLRSSDPKFLGPMTTWLTYLMKKIYPLLHKNGGSIIMIQIENEYGSYGECDNKYLQYLRDLTHKILGDDVQLYTTDGVSDKMLKCGAVEGVYPTIDFGTVDSKNDVEKYFKLQRKYAPRGPLVNSEFYTGWFESYEEETNFPNTTSIIKTLNWISELNASVSLYMMAGGTNFEYWSGKLFNGGHVITSYDYKSPISENGDVGETYLAIQNWTSNLKDWQWKQIGTSKNISRRNYGEVKVEPIANTIRLMKENCSPGSHPHTFEEMEEPYGFAIYRAQIKKVKTVAVKGIKDAGYIMISDRYYGKVTEKNHSLDINFEGDGGFDIIVENMGRQNYESIIDIKGILNNDITFDNKTIDSWESCSMSIKIVDRYIKRKGMKTIRNRSKDHSFEGPTILQGTLIVYDLHDTYILLSDFTKGVVVINGFNLGRYWNIKTSTQKLYIPKSYLKIGKNRVVIFELEGNTKCGNGCYVEFNEN